MSHGIFKILFLVVIGVSSASVWAKSAAYEVDVKAEVLGQAGKVKIQREFCNTDGYDCDYVLYDGKGQRQVLIEDWSRTAHVYQFSPKQMGFLFGATGSGHMLTVINDQNQQKQYADFKAMNEARNCMVTHERGLNNMPDSLVFYSVPDFRVRLVLNDKVPQFKGFRYPLTAYFEDNGDFSFNFDNGKSGEDGQQDVIIQNPCQANYRIVMN